MSLHGFFAAMQPMLLGRTSAAQVEAQIGASPSGREALAFYGVLVSRNVHKILREVCPTLWIVAARAGAWPALVADYLAAHPPQGGDPNRFADALPEFLRARDVPQLWAELADYHVAHVTAHHALDDGSDGFDRRLFVRQYTSPVADIVEALARDRLAALAEPRPTLLVIFRHARSERVRRLVPSAAGLAALARRQGLALPPALASIPERRIAAAEAALVREGVLVPRLTCVTEENCDA